jgi:hypothetical protein
MNSHLLLVLACVVGILSCIDAQAMRGSVVPSQIGTKPAPIKDAQAAKIDLTNAASSQQQAKPVVYSAAERLQARIREFAHKFAGSEVPATIRENSPPSVPLQVPPQATDSDAAEQEMPVEDLMKFTDVFPELLPAGSDATPAPNPTLGLTPRDINGNVPKADTLGPKDSKTGARRNLQFNDPYADGLGGYGAEGYAAAGLNPYDTDGDGLAGGYGAAGIGVAGYGAAGIGVAGYGAAGIGVAGYGAAGIGVAGYGAAGIGVAGVGVAGIGDYSTFNAFNIGLPANLRYYNGCYQRRVATVWSCLPPNALTSIFDIPTGVIFSGGHWCRPTPRGLVVIRVAGGGCWRPRVRVVATAAYAAPFAATGPYGGVLQTAAAYQPNAYGYGYGQYGYPNLYGVASAESAEDN